MFSVLVWLYTYNYPGVAGTPERPGNLRMFGDVFNEHQGHLIRMKRMYKGVGR